MAASVNKTIILGNLVRDPESRAMSNGTSVCNVTVATNRSWKSKDTGEKVEESEFHRVVFFDRLAEIAQQYLAKGNPVYIEGRLKTRKWTDANGVEKYSTEIVAEEMHLLGSKDGGGERQHSTQGREPAQAVRPQGRASQQQPASRQRPAQDDPFASIDDEIPF